jgi:HEAT repeat protein
MSNGIHAIKGFDYQATVILDRLFEHFDRNGPTARVRPEGVDDLDLFWTKDAVEHRRYEQIKKPREDDQGNLKPRPWTLSDVVGELLPNTIVNLSNNNYEQVWIVGDEVSDEVKSLVSSRENAPITAAETYWNAIHLLARNDAINGGGIDQSMRSQLLRRPPADLTANPADALNAMTRAFAEHVRRIGAPDDVADRYRTKATELHRRLPSILARTQIRPIYGTEEDVIKRVYDRLEQRYGLQRSVIENTLFRNLRGFINDISKQPGRSFDQAEFEFELRWVWPHMIVVKDAPPLDPNHIARPDLAERFTTRWTGKAIEAVGISASGKTMLAAEAAEKSLATEPDRRVYYAEVRPGVTLRDVLVGLAYHLRRIGIEEPFALSVDGGLTGEEVLARLARSYSAIPQQILLLVDLVEGSIDTAFARDLATFVRALSSSTCRIAVFGQESGLRELTQLERDELGVNRLDIRGFGFDEFVTLVGRYHPQPDRAALYDIYQRVTAVRAAGLFAGLAQAIARAQSLKEMSDIAARPAEDTLAFAERQRFGRVTEGARSGAEKIVCFALPFQRKDAEEIFPNDNIGAAVHELQALGLLRFHDKISFEMHETVRAGLEGAIALNVRRAAHEVLAGWYGRQGVITAEILHLEKAGEQIEANARARDAFLRGERWAALAAYVTKRRLVSPDDVISTMGDTHAVEDKSLFSTILRGLREPVDVEELLRTLRKQPERVSADYQWAMAMFEAVLEFEPARLPDLMRFIIEAASEPDRMESALGSLMIAARRKNGLIGPQTVGYFKNAPPETKRRLLPFMLFDRRRDALRAVFEFLASDFGPVDQQRRGSPWRDLALQIGSKEDAVEFLAAIPDVQPAAMLTARSALLGPLDGMIWSKRKELRTHCIQILTNATEEEKVLESAIRVLVFLAEPSICALCDPLLSRKDKAGRLAALVPVLVPSLCDRGRYEARVLDRNASLEDRATALLVLSSVGADIGRIYRLVKAQKDDDKNAQRLEFLFVSACAQAPFPDLIPALEQWMKSANDKTVPIIVAALMRLSELPESAVTPMLIGALSNKNRAIRQCAAISLGRRRSRIALDSLLAQYANEDDEALAVSLAVAIVASGPHSVADLPSTRHKTLGIRLWQCILATRLRDATFADRLVECAVDGTLNWQLRRAAIFAAGRVPYEAALEKILPVVMQERSSLTIDGCQNFQCHELVSSVLLCGSQAMIPIFARGKAGFVAFFGEIFEETWKASTSREGLPSGAELAGWLFDRLTHYGWPAQTEAPDRVLNELHIPILQSAVLRSLRLLGRADLIEAQLPNAYHVWFAMKCLLERARSGQRDPGLNARLKGLVDASAFKANALLYRVIDEFAVTGATAPVPAPPPTASQEAATPSVLHLNYDDAVRALSRANPDFKSAIPVVLDSVTKEQLEHLVLLAEPANDQYPSTETYVPLVSFTPNGHVVAQRRVTTTGGETAGALIRPAIAAANRFGLNVPWHQELLTGILATAYIPRFLAALGSQDDSGRFYEELANQEDLLMPRLCTTAQATPVLKYIDARIVPFLLRYIASGTDEFFEGLCILARQVTGTEIDTVLSGLLYRWTQRFDVRSLMSQHDHNYALWRGFKRLTENPRFEMIEGWQSRLASVLQVPLAYHGEDIVRVLERDPRSYSLIESRLFRATNWQHFHQDEIDRLDAAAERLFPQLLES